MISPNRAMILCSSNLQILSKFSTKQLDENQNGAFTTNTKDNPNYQCNVMEEVNNEVAERVSGDVL